MSHTLLEEITTIRRQARRLVVARGVLSFLAVTIMVALSVGMLDYLLRFQDPGLRIIASASLLAASVLAFRHFVYPAVSYRCSDVRMAQQIERRFPELSDRLSCAIAFAHQSSDDATAGSSALREAAIADTANLIQGMPLRDCLDTRLVWRVVLGFMVLVAIVAGTFALDAGTALLAARRLVSPLGSDTWPRSHVLVFTKMPRRLAVGDDFEVELIDDRGRLPDRVTLEYRFEDDDREQVQSQPLKPWGDRAVGRLENVSRSFQYRAKGGDDDTMEWISLDVVEPPRIADLRIQVHPPDYTRLPAKESGRHIRAWEGSRVEMAGSVDKPVRSLSVIADTTDGQRVLPGVTDEARRGFALPGDPDEPWFLRDSGTYGFELIDAEGYASRDFLHSEIHVQADRPPTVSVAAPAVSSHFTTDALVAVRAIVKDDLAVRTVELHYNGQQIELTAGKDDSTRGRSSSQDVSLEGGETRTVDYAWDLGRLSDLGPGETVEFYVTASDYRPQYGRSAAVRLIIISADELRTRIDERQSRIALRLREALRLQRTARSQTNSLDIQWRETSFLTREDLDYLQSAELNQRQVGQVLENSHDGVMRLIDGVLEELASNRVDRPQVADRLTWLLEEIQAITRESLPAIQHELTRTLKMSRSVLREVQADRTENSRAPAEGVAISAATIEPLSVAGQAQDDVIQKLEVLLGRLAQWEGYRLLIQELGTLRRDQQAIARDTTSLTTAAEDVRTLKPLQRAELKRLAQRQLEVARELDRLQSRMGRSRTELEESDPRAATTLSDAVTTAERRGLSGLMRESAGRIEENQIGQASRQQQEVLRGLEELLDRLAEPNTWLRQTVSKLLSRQQSLHQRTQKLDSSRDANSDSPLPEDEATIGELAEEQRQLSKETTNGANDPRLAVTFQVAIKCVGRSMRRAAEWLEQRISDHRAGEEQREAVRLLQTLLASLESDQQIGPTASSERGGAEGRQGNRAQVSPAELMLLRELQLEVNRRTIDLDGQPAQETPLRVRREGAFVELAHDQGQLADLMLGMASPEPDAQGHAATPDDRLPDHELNRALQDAGIPGFGRTAPDEGTPRTPRAKQTGSRPLGEDLGQPEDDNLWDQVGRRMRNSEQLILRKDASENTQRIQEQIVSDLTSLIETLRQQESSEHMAGGASQNAAAQAGEDPGEVPGTSHSSPDEQRPAVGTSADAKDGTNVDLILEVWGHLPDQIQKQIQSPGQEEFLPSYERLIVEYYKRLAKGD